jgi:galactokinase
MAIVTGIEQGIYARVRKHHKFIVFSEIEKEDDKFECNMEQSELKAIAKSRGYYSYVAGVASCIKEQYCVEGLEICVTQRTLPVKAGLSSSASICVLVARAFNLLYNLHLSAMGEMMIAYQGEQRTLSRCGRLDQACVFGLKPVCMYFDGADIKVELLNIKKELYFVIADLNGEKDTIKILSDLNKCYPFAETEKEKKVHEALGEDNQKIVNRAVKYMEIGDVKELGNLMLEAQALFDKKVVPACPEQLSAPILHSVLKDDYIKELT